MSASSDAQNQNRDLVSPCAGLTTNALPEVSSQNSEDYSNTGVSTNSVHTRSLGKENKQWYILRTTYGQEKKAYDYIISHGGIAYYPTITTIQDLKGRRKEIKTSCLPNLFFAYGTLENIKMFVYDNVHLPYLRFYYKHYHRGATIIKEPLTIPSSQLDSLRIICEMRERDILIIDEEIHKFQKGDIVEVIDGDFKGVKGCVARFQGQQRVGVVINGLLTAVTAYIPNAFLKPINQ